MAPGSPVIYFLLSCLAGQAMTFALSIADLTPFGETCTEKHNCRTAFALCVDGKCKCLPGFEEKDGICSPLEYRCPSGQPLRKDGKVVECEITLPVWPETVITDDCPSDYKCFVYLHAETEHGNQRGHCCSNFKLDRKVNVCPIGEQDTNGTCPDLSKFPADYQIPEEERRTCPYGNYDCVGSACCPEPCPASNIFFDVSGLCYTRVFLDKPCTIDAECYPNARCKEKGGKKTCRCVEGYIPDTIMDCRKL